MTQAQPEYTVTDRHKSQGEMPWGAPLWSVDTFLWAGVVLGLLSRVHRLLDNRSLWGDEAMLVLNIVVRTFSELLSPLHNELPNGDSTQFQVAPIPFLIMEKAVTFVFGTNEMALRLISCIAGVLSIFLFYRIARSMLQHREALMAAFLFSILEPLVYYSAEVKQYSMDVLIALLMWHGSLSIVRVGTSLRSLSTFALLGALAVWFSHPAVFVCAGLGTTLIVNYWYRGKRTEALKLALVACVWAVSFLMEYVYVLHETRGNEYLKYFWKAYFPPVPPTSRAELAWYWRSIFGFFNDPLDLPRVEVAALTFAIGGVLLYGRDRTSLALVVAPVAVTLLASLCRLYPFPTTLYPDISDRLYPFMGRLLLFTVPLCLILLAVGLSFFLDYAKQKYYYIGVIALVLLLWLPVYQQVMNAIYPPRLQEMRPIVAQLRSRLAPGDRIYSQSFSDPVFEYYARRERLEVDAVKAGISTKDDARAFLESLSELRPNQRVWLLTLRHPTWNSEFEKQKLLSALSKVAIQV